MKKKTLSLLLLIVASSANAQTGFFYGYDATGNRTYRLASFVRSNNMTRALTDTTMLQTNSKVNVQFSQDYRLVKVEIACWDEKMQADAVVYDLTGKEIFSERINTSVTTIDLSKLRKGTFILSLCLNGEFWNRKFNK